MTTVVLTTHYMAEAEHLCSRVGILDHGRLIALDTVPALIRDHAGDTTAHLTLTRPHRRSSGRNSSGSPRCARCRGTRFSSSR